MRFEWRHLADTRCKIKRLIVNFNGTEDRPEYPVSSDGYWNNPTGRVFVGDVTVECEDGNVWTGGIQTGGMRTRDSTVRGPSDDNPQGDDSAVPGGDFTISTSRPGKGFPINTSGTSRGDITMHYASYRGSHGCPTLTSTTEWEDLKELMKNTREKFSVNSVPIRIQYSGVEPPEVIEGMDVTTPHKPHSDFRQIRDPFSLM